MNTFCYLDKNNNRVPSKLYKKIKQRHSKLANVWVDRLVVVYTFSFYMLGFNAVRMLDETNIENAFTKGVFYTFGKCKHRLLIGMV